MALLPILKYPDERLYRSAEPVRVFDASLRSLVSDMAETMYAAPGIGLAATQVDVHRQIIVMDTTEDRNQLIILINPDILESRGKQLCEEGCLSVPGIYDEVERAEWVRVIAQDIEGKSFEIEADKLQAICIQHEMDHLLGKVFVDYLSRLKRSRIKAKMLKLQREKD